MILDKNSVDKTFDKWIDTTIELDMRCGWVGQRLVSERCGVGGVEPVNEEG